MKRHMLCCFILPLSTVTCTLAGNTGAANRHPQIHIAAVHQVVQMGDPVPLQVNCRFTEPQMSRRDPNMVLTTYGSDDITVEIRRGGSRVAYLPVLPDAFRLKGEDGREYSTDLILFYDHYSQKMIFDTPGEYVIAVMMARKDSALVTITVRQPEAEGQKKAIDLLQPRDFLLLEAGSAESEKARAEAVSRLAQMSDRYPRTTMGQWAAARVGMEFHEAYILQLQRKDPGEKEVGRTFGLTKEELLNRADRYLQRAKDLEDAFPLREECLYLLYSVKGAEGDRQSADALLRELAAKYPLGRFGRMAAQRISPDAKK
jgi:hypothetical protein